MPPDVAAIVVNYRTPALTIECVDALAAAAGGVEYEVVVVDNASGDDSVERISSHSRVIACAENRGFAAGVNAGFAATQAPIVVVLNPDALPECGAVVALVEHLGSSPRVGVAAPRLLDAAGVPLASAYRRFPGVATLFSELCLPIGYALERLPALDSYRVPPTEYARGTRVAHVCGACMAIRRKAYEDAGPFDEGFFLYLEETEWQRRLAARGWAVELVPEARVRHLVRGGGDGALAPSEHYAASAVRYFSEPDWLVRAVMAGAAIVSWFSLHAVSAARADDRTRRQAAAWLRFVRATLRR